MRLVKLDDWNARYRAGDAPADPSPFLIEAAADLKPGRALDLACGAGRNAIWLAERGWEVVAFDAAGEAIEIIRERAPSIDARAVDLENGEPLPFEDASFDLVVILYYLHRPLYAEAERVLKPGGTIVAAARLSGINPEFCVQPGELRRIFAGWQITLDRESETAELVARK